MTDQPTAPTTAPEAAARLNTLTADPAWGQRLVAGNIDARKEFDTLTTTLANADTGAEVLAGKSSQLYPWTGEGQLSPQALAQGVESLRQIGLPDAVIVQVLAGDQAPVTRAEHDAARRHMASKQADQGWTKKLLKGDAEAKGEFALMCVVLNSTVKQEAAA